MRDHELRTEETTRLSAEAPDASPERAPSHYVENESELRSELGSQMNSDLGLESEEPRASLRQRLLWLMLARVILSLGIGLCFLYLLRASSFSPLYSEGRVPLIVAVFVIIYLFNLVLICTLKYLKHHLSALALAQLALDCIGASVLMYLTGGLESPLIFLFALYVTMGAIALSRQGAWFTVVISVGGLVLLCINEVGQIEFERGGGVKALRYILTSGLYQLALLSFIAMLTSYLSEQARAAQLKLSFARLNMRTLECLNEHLLTSVHNGIIYCDPSGLIQITNRATEQLLGLRAADLLNQPLQNIFKRLPLTLVGRELATRFSATSYFDRGEVYSWSQEYWRHDRINVTLDLTLSMVSPSVTPHDRHVQGWVLILQDVTLRRRLEARNERREHLASLGEVAAQIAHEVRNPLAGMLSSLELLRSHYEGQIRELGLSPDLALNIKSGYTFDLKLIDIVEREAQRINTLTDSLLKLTRPPTAQPITLDIAEVILELAALEPNRIKVQLTEPLIAHVDPDQLRQVLWNLFRNAWEAQSDIVEVSAEVRELTSGGGSVSAWEVTLYITDYGVGFGDHIENLDDLFKPFWSDKEQGTGLGLSISRSLLEAQGGMLEARRHPTGGALFLVTLPGAEHQSE